MILPEWCEAHAMAYGRRCSREARRFTADLFGGERGLHVCHQHFEMLARFQKQGCANKYLALWQAYLQAPPQ